MMDLLLLGIYPWNYTHLSDTVRCMTSAMTDECPVFLNPQAERRSFAIGWQERQEHGIRIWNPPYSFLPTRHGVHRMREKLSAAALRQYVARALGSGWQDRAVLYVTASTLEQSYEITKILKPKRLIFDILDDNLGFPGITSTQRNKLMRMFLQIAERAEVITAVSQYLVDQTAEWTGRQVKHLSNGVDVDRFRSTPDLEEPQDLKQIPRPRMAFVGAITSWIDLRLLEKSARALPELQLLMIGPELISADPVSLQKLKRLPNVHFLGAKSFTDVPRYMHASDVLLVPRTYEPYSLACDPIKLYEYLATGKPVVSTAMPSAERFADVVFIGRDDESFIEGIRCALQRNQAEGLQQAKLVDGLSWKTRADQLMSLLHR